jgi:hypothetical protein
VKKTEKMHTFLENLWDKNLIVKGILFASDSSKTCPSFLIRMFLL